MSPYRRNVLVGVVVVFGLGVLAWMLIQFGGNLMAPFAPDSIKVRIVADRADGVSNGSPVTYLGMVVGRVEMLSRTDDHLSVLIGANIDKEPPLPANIRAVIRTQLVGGGGAISLETTDPQPAGTLQANQTIPGRHLGADLLPPEIGSLATELRLTAQQFRETNLIGNLDAQINNIGKLLESIRTVVDDQEMRTNLNAALVNVRNSTEKADRIAANLEKFSGDLEKLSANANGAVTDARTTIGKTEAEILTLSKQLSDRMQQVSRLLDTFNAVADKVNKGEGTAGALVNDPKLYQNLVETSQQLQAMITDLRRLVQQWEQEGVPFKLR